MTAFAETLDSERDKANIPRAIFHHTPLENLEDGQLISYAVDKFNQGDIYDIIQTLFVDDSAFVFESRKDLTKGLGIIKCVFDCFGLEIHLGKV